MATGMWTSVSGASAQAQNIDMVANNLANSDTLAFKKDVPTFKEYLSVVERDHAAGDIPRSPIKDKDFYPVDGRDQSFVVVDGTYTNFKQGFLRVTQSPLDIAMDGPGFIEVSTPAGSRFTRAGSLKLSMDGHLVTSEGYPVLSNKPGGLVDANAPGNLAQPARYISLKDKGTNITINETGEIYADDEMVAKLNLTEFQNLNKLRKTGGGLYENKDSANIAPAVLRTRVKQGMLETSNVNPIEEMTNLIKANRLFEHDLKSMKTYNEMMGREANDIGKL